MSNDILRWGLGAVVVAHGVGHILFMPLLAQALRWEATGQSWILTGILGDGPVRWLATIVAGAVVIGFVAAGIGIVVGASWWRGLVSIAAIASIVLIVATWDGIPTSSAILAVAFDVIVLVAVQLVHWPSTELLGT